MSDPAKILPDGENARPPFASVISSLLAFAFLTVACTTTASPTQGVSLDCALPWGSMSQVRGCADADVRIMSMSGDRLDIRVREKDHDRIARAMAGAFVLHGDMSDQLAIWAWSKAAAIHSGGYDRGIASEQAGAGERLMFEICTDWDAAPGPGDLCTDVMRFTVQ
jgi:hypothetical protein